MTPKDSHPSAAALRGLDADLSQMAALVESQLQSAITAFERRDVTAAERVIVTDQRIDEFDRDIETKIMALLAEQHLPKNLLQQVMTIMKVTGELERIGDLAKNVGKRTLVVSREKVAPPNMGVARMGRASLRQLSDILDAYHDINIEAANAVWGGDDELDALYNSVFEEILSAMMADSSTVNACTHLVFIAKNFERVGDHATNIAEAIHFLVTGSPMHDPRPKNDETSTMVVAPSAQAAE